MLKNPAHPGEIIGDTLEEMGVSISEAARALGVTRQQLHNVIAGRSAISSEMALRLELAVGSTADAWLKLQQNYEITQIRNRTATIAGTVTRLEPKVA